MCDNLVRLKKRRFQAEKSQMPVHEILKIKGKKSCKEKDYVNYDNIFDYRGECAAIRTEKTHKNRVYVFGKDRMFC